MRHSHGLAHSLCSGGNLVLLCTFPHSHSFYRYPKHRLSPHLVENVFKVQLDCHFLEGRGSASSFHSSAGSYWLYPTVAFKNKNKNNRTLICSYNLESWRRNSSEIGKPVSYVTPLQNLGIWHSNHCVLGCTSAGQQNRLGSAGQLFWSHLTCTSWCLCDQSGLIRCYCFLGLAGCWPGGLSSPEHLSCPP